MTNHIYDVIVIGGGPAGYTSALYGARSGFDILVIEKFSAGGQMTQTTQIDNYPGFPEGIDGFTLGFNMQNGAERFGAKTLSAEVLSVSLSDKIKTVETSEGTYLSKSIIVATGAEHMHLGLPDEEKFIGRGLGYCAACDGMFYKGKTVAVVGGGNSAAADALLLSKICEKVYIIHRRDTLRAERFYHKPLFDAENVEFIWNSTVVDILSDGKVNGVRVKTIDRERDIPVDGVFISIGRRPQTELFEGQLALDEKGYIISGETTKTNLDGVYAVGDVRTKPVRQIVTAVADGATAIHFVEEYLATI